jgi:hypothetical protein
MLGATNCWADHPTTCVASSRWSTQTIINRICTKQASHTATPHHTLHGIQSCDLVSSIAHSLRYLFPVSVLGVMRRSIYEFVRLCLCGGRDKHKITSLVATLVRPGRGAHSVLRPHKHEQMTALVDPFTLLVILCPRQLPKDIASVRFLARICFSLHCASRLIWERQVTPATWACSVFTSASRAGYRR